MQIAPRSMPFAFPECALLREFAKAAHAFDHEAPFGARAAEYVEDAAEKIRI